MPYVLAAAVPDSLLTVLRVIFLVRLYLFLLRVIRAVWSELQEPKGVPVFAGVPEAAGPAPLAPSRSRSRGSVERLVLLEPVERKGQVFELGDELTVGGRRAAACRCPTTRLCPRSHARVFRRDGSLFVEDLGSTNGTFLNRKAVSGPTALSKGDHLQIGRSVLEVTK